MFDYKAKFYLKKYFNERKDNNNAMFINNNKPYNRVGQRNLETIIKQIAKRANIERNVYPHLFRHTFASNAIERDMPIQMVSMLLGHSKLDTTLIYAKNSLTTIKSEYNMHIG